MRLFIIGTGYVGLVTGACFAEMGHEVTCFDINKEKISALQQGKIPIFEPGLEEIVRRNSLEGRLRFVDEPTGLSNAQAAFIAVDTSVDSEGHVNLTSVQMAARQIAEQMTCDQLVVVKSTVLPGTSRQIKELISQKLSERVDLAHPPHFELVVNPEFLKEGDAVQDCLKPDRIILGVDSDQALKVMKTLYAPFMLSRERFVAMDPVSAELTKFTANAMLALRVSFMNMMSKLSEKVGADINAVRQGIGSDHRIGINYLYPGVGYGGSCFPKDLRALNRLGKELGVPLPITEAVEGVNDQQKRHLPELIKRWFDNRGGIAGRRLAILGLAFKPNTDDMREAPSLTIIDLLIEWGASLCLYDPVAMNTARKAIASHPAIEWAQTISAAADRADALVLVTEWKLFRFLDFAMLQKVMAGRVLFDGRNQYRPEEVTSAGFDYISIGRPACFVPNM